MNAAEKPPLNTCTISIEIDRGIADQAEIIARQYNFADLGAALANLARIIALEHRIPLEGASETEQSRTRGGPYGGATFSRLATLARESGHAAVDKAHAAGKSTSYTEDGRVMRELPDGSKQEVTRSR